MSDPKPEKEAEPKPKKEVDNNPYHLVFIDCRGTASHESYRSLQGLADALGERLNEQLQEADSKYDKPRYFVFVGQRLLVEGPYAQLSVCDHLADNEAVSRQPLIL